MAETLKPYYDFKRNLVQIEAYSEYCDNIMLLSAARLAVTGNASNAEWAEIQNYFFFNRLRDVNAGLNKNRIEEMKSVIKKLNLNVAKLRGNQSIEKLLDFFSSTTGHDLLYGSVTNCKGYPKRLSILELINFYADCVLSGKYSNKDNLFIGSEYHNQFKKLGREYTDIREYYGPFYVEQKDQDNISIAAFYDYIEDGGKIYKVPKKPLEPPTHEQ